MWLYLSKPIYQCCDHCVTSRPHSDIIYSKKKEYKIWYILEAKSMYQVHTFWYTGIQVCTKYIPVYDIVYTSGTAIISFLKGTSVYILTSFEYILSVSDSFCAPPGPAGLLDFFLIIMTEADILTHKCV
jgi:hypothetical protein